MEKDTPSPNEEFYRKLEGLLHAPPNSIQGSAELSKFKAWDSLTILEFMVLIDTDYGSDIQPAQIAECKTVNDLAQLVLAPVAEK